ncbi:LCP family protein, partial [Thalassiella azotivora]
ADAGGGATQRTFVMALTDPASGVVGAALVGTDGRTTSALLMPSRLLVDVAGGGRVPLGDALATGDAAVGQSVEDALDVRVDGTWVLTTDGLQELVNALGGVAVDVPAAVTTDSVTIPAGNGQRLDGVQAVAYATYLAPEEAETARSARLSQVLTGLLSYLPSAVSDVEGLLLSLGENSRSTQPVEVLAEVLVEVKQTLTSNQYGATVLPVQEISTGDENVIYGIDEAEAGPVLQTRFSGALRPGGPDAVRVLVQNGVGSPGLGDRARDRLVEAGFRYVGGGNATSLGRDTSVVAVASDSPEDREDGLAVAEALGLPAEVVAVGRDAPTLADVVVVLGQDFADQAD